MRFERNGARSYHDSSTIVSSTIRAPCDTIVNLRCLEMLHMKLPPFCQCKVVQSKDVGIAVGLSALWDCRQAFQT